METVIVLIGFASGAGNGFPGECCGPDSDNFLLNSVC